MLKSELIITKSLQEKVFIRVLFISVIALTVFLLNAIVVLRDPTIIFANSVVLILLLAMYYMARYRGLYMQMIIPYTILAIVAMNGTWFLSGGYVSSNSYIMIAILVVGIIASKHQYTFYLLLLIISNIVILFSIEYFYPELVNSIDVQKDIISHALVFVACVLTINYLIVQLKDSYRAEQEKVSQINDDLVLRNDEIQQQNEIINRQNQELKFYSEQLEQKVKKRTELLSKLNDELKRQNNTLEQFTFMTAHNLRSPVAHIKGLINLLPHQISDIPDSSEILERLRESAVNLDNVVGDITSILNIKKGDKKLEKLNLRKILDLTIDTLEKDLNDKKANLNIECQDDIEIKGVRSYFQSIFYNLLHNAIKYSSLARQPEISITCRKSVDEIFIECADNGIGFDMKMAKNKIFQLYQRFNTEYQGKGYGLFLTKTQVEAMGGAIDVKSKLGQGTTFQIRFPKSHLDLKPYKPDSQ